MNWYKPVRTCTNPYESVLIFEKKLIFNLQRNLNMRHIKPPYFMTAQILAELIDCDIRFAMNTLTAIRKHYNKRVGGYITLKEYCDYERISRPDLEDYY